MDCILLILIVFCLFCFSFNPMFWRFNFTSRNHFVLSYHTNKTNNNSHIPIKLMAIMIEKPVDWIWCDLSILYNRYTMFVSSSLFFVYLKKNWFAKYFCFFTHSVQIQIQFFFFCFFIRDNLIFFSNSYFIDTQIKMI